MGRRVRVGGRRFVLTRVVFGREEMGKFHGREWWNEEGVWLGAKTDGPELVPGWKFPRGIYEGSGPLKMFSRKVSVAAFGLLGVTA